MFVIVMEKRVKVKIIVDSASDMSKMEAAKYMMGCTIGTHIGPGAVGIAYFDKK